MKSLRKGISLVVSLTPCLVMAEIQTDIAKELAEQKAQNANLQAQLQQQQQIMQQVIQAVNNHQQVLIQHQGTIDALKKGDAEAAPQNAVASSNTQQAAKAEASENTVNNGRAQEQKRGSKNTASP